MRPAEATAHPGDGISDEGIGDQQTRPVIRDLTNFPYMPHYPATYDDRDLRFVPAALMSAFVAEASRLADVAMAEAVAELRRRGDPVQCAVPALEDLRRQCIDWLFRRYVVERGLGLPSRLD